MRSSADTGLPAQPPIADYSVVGDTRTAALCSSMGSIDWMCIPRFDSEPVFSHLVGGRGRFAISPRDVTATRRTYLDRTTVMRTTWTTTSGEAELTEGMITKVTGSLLPQVVLVRKLRCIGGNPSFTIDYNPRYGLPGEPPRAEFRMNSVICSWGGLSAVLTTRPVMTVTPGEPVEMQLEQGGEITFAFSVSERTPIVFIDPERAATLLDEDSRWWQQWTESAHIVGEHSATLERSLITLRLLTYSPSGAPVAAPTTSLPEKIGGDRNWDYRYAWPRDASIGVNAFIGAGKDDLAFAFMRWLLHAQRVTRPRIDVLYTLDGRPGPPEKEVEAAGYLGSKPVRIGNEAASQFQLDVYGWVIDAAARLSAEGHSLNTETRRMIAGAADFVCKSWTKPDNGVWEVRGDPQHFVHSKMMTWLSLDRAISLGFRSNRAAIWKKNRSMLAEEIRSRAWDERRGAYIRYYGADELDASVALPLVEFEEPGSPRISSTLDAIVRELGAGGPLIYRYDGQDGLDGREGAFLPCSFWMVHSLARDGRIEEAEQMLDELCELANDVDLFPEEIDPTTKQHLGNFPQALTHASAILAALTLDRALDRMQPDQGNRGDRSPRFEEDPQKRSVNDMRHHGDQGRSGAEVEAEEPGRFEDGI